ncbi:uncharacterized protein LOC105628461 isoform X1 [Jatropha curcas]|uniref:uncharacterized protein LOC105628461 isoform X1 n=1 Tax=Jatropha curcas TaxID=180498 RepID=UPI0018932ECC|nr:uncharacterized protein LOC105628461 isoform X1 [Jatropha curcas]XP_037496504.1 uncharacterized protein LOC105628461 isoform X1 [Jatropha curcas]XP_037496505.1 uncharacterized protein LOC105628461 isoform X1 [Jatropha curcas]XP_037496506.1 uncharacterized protein LOC105628461 isoform X1 [Jatropha curcas]XP_037496507.1 uncharacterized protein LOC105628461 isoform X1 [Jatropha curcas]XP_037496508.1 uncharacterized protein LOC105628461 isoform X1 [Jatropha curcas]
MEQLKLSDRMEELLMFTLQSHINQTLEVDLPLSKDFCSNLLRDEPNDSVSLPASSNTSSFGGVPQYPLFKRLALALCQSIISGSFCKTYNKIGFFEEDICPKQKEEQWNKLIIEKGFELMNVLKVAFYELHVQEPFFSQIKNGLKTVEGRCAGGKYSRIEPGAMVLLNKSIVLEVEDVRRYASFLEMLEAESPSKVLPGVKTIEEGVKLYRNFYTEEREMPNGVLAISLSKFSPQPYLYLANILSELSYDGVQSLLGLAHTAGTVPDALPPARSTLLSSFTLPYRPNVKVSSLTHGARALAKHAERSSNKYWGILSGNDTNKNRLAMNVINRLIAACCWSNVHIVPPHGAVFEIRVADGYGARWSKDGTKFIGFLEPYMEDGYSRGWKH